MGGYIPFLVNMVSYLRTLANASFKIYYWTHKVQVPWKPELFAKKLWFSIKCDGAGFFLKISHIVILEPKYFKMGPKRSFSSFIKIWCRTFSEFSHEVAATLSIRLTQMIFRRESCVAVFRLKWVLNENFQVLPKINLRNFWHEVAGRFSKIISLGKFSFWVLTQNEVLWNVNAVNVQIFRMKLQQDKRLKLTQNLFFEKDCSGFLDKRPQKLFF